jgi:hypothetical protein
VFALGAWFFKRLVMTVQRSPVVLLVSVPNLRILTSDDPSIPATFDISHTYKPQVYVQG